jgi:hypothetical protein
VLGFTDFGFTSEQQSTFNYPFGLSLKAAFAANQAEQSLFARHSKQRSTLQLPIDTFGPLL